MGDRVTASEVWSQEQRQTGCREAENKEAPREAETGDREILTQEA